MRRFLRRLVSGRRPVREPVRLVLYTKPGCALCDEMKAQLSRARAGAGVPFTVDEVDIVGDAELERAYALSVPVLVVGRRRFEGRLTLDELERALDRLAEEEG